MINLIGLAFAGFLALTLIGLPMLVIYWRRYTLERRLPVIPGAPLPPMRFDDGPEVRACAKCSAPATVYKVTRHTVNGIATGTDYEYRCSQCKREFQVESVWGMVFETFATLVVYAVAVAFFAWSKSAGWRYGGTAVTALIALALTAKVVEHLLARRRNPVIAAPIARVIKG
jgi:hypothetical protein